MIQNVRFVSASVLAVTLLGSAAYAAPKTGLGSRKQPIRLSMVPSSDSTKIMTNMAPIAKCLEKETGYYFDINVPNSFIVVVEGMGAKRVDVAFINTFGYLLANERYGAEALLKASREGETTYKGQILTRAGSDIKKIEDLQGKKIAYVDPASTSGYILAKKLLDEKKVKPGEEVFAGKHDVVVTMVYQGQVDAGATFYNAPGKNGELRDARKNVLTQFPDIEKKVSILSLTEDIPNDPIVVRKEIEPAMKEKLKSGFQTCVAQNVEAFKGVNSSDALAPVTDADYDGLRKTVKALNIDLGAALAPKKK